MSQAKKVVAKTNTPTRASKRVVKSKQAKPIKLPKIAKVNKGKVVKRAANKTSYHDMVKNAITHLPKSRHGVSRQAILKFVISNNNLADHNQKLVKYHVNSSLVSSTNKGEIARVKGTGAAGSFKLVGISKSNPTTPNEGTKKASPATPKKAKATPSKKAVSPKPAKKALTKEKAASKTKQANNSAEKPEVKKVGTKSRPVKH